MEAMPYTSGPGFQKVLGQALNLSLHLPIGRLPRKADV